LAQRQVQVLASVRQPEPAWEPVLAPVLAPGWSLEQARVSVLVLVLVRASLGWSPGAASSSLA
jgi:hypothetical protein